MTGSGKTAVALRLGVLVSNPAGGQKFGTHEVEHGIVVYIACENDTDVLHRLIAMTERMGLDPDKIKFYIINRLEKTLEKDIPRITAKIKA